MGETPKKTKDSDICNKKFTPTKYFATECNREMMLMEEQTLRSKG